MHKIFVYGTLRSGQSRSFVLSEQLFLGQSRTASMYTLVDLGLFPAMLPKGYYSIVGEVYMVDDACLDQLDMIEGHPHFYRRETIVLDDGSKAISYLLYRDIQDTPVIESGDWVNW